MFIRYYTQGTCDAACQKMSAARLVVYFDK